MNTEIAMNYQSFNVAIGLLISTMLLPTSAGPVATASLIRRETQSADCATIGDGDIYGIGVRIGLYLQWASTFILRNLGSWDRIRQVRQATNCICGALALAAAINVIDGSALSIDYLLSYYLTIVLFYSESYNLVREWGPRSNQDEDGFPQSSRDEDSFTLSAVVYRLHPDWTLVFQNIIFASYTLFGAWFWQKGYLATRPTVCGETAAIMFLFDFHSAKWRNAATVLAALLGFVLFLVLLIHLRSLKRGILFGPELTFVRTLNTLSGYPTEMLFVALLRPKLFRKVILDEDFFFVTLKSWKKVLPFLLRFFHYFIIYFAGPIIAISSVERMIKANHVETTGINHSTGQMISLLTGTISFILSLWEVFMKLMLDADSMAEEGRDGKFTVNKRGRPGNLRR